MLARFAACNVGCNDACSGPLPLPGPAIFDYSFLVEHLESQSVFGAAFLVPFVNNLFTCTRWWLIAVLQASVVCAIDDEVHDVSMSHTAGQQYHALSIV